jgi:hypothetical protein
MGYYPQKGRPVVASNEKKISHIWEVSDRTVDIWLTITKTANVSHGTYHAILLVYGDLSMHYVRGQLVPKNLTADPREEWTVTSRNITARVNSNPRILNYYVTGNYMQYCISDAHSTHQALHWKSSSSLRNKTQTWCWRCFIIGCHSPQVNPIQQWSPNFFDHASLYQ